MSGQTTGDSGRLGSVTALFSRPMLAAIALAVGVVVVSLAVFDWRQQTRVADLDRQYARTAAHVGRQVELLLESYQRVASNLEPVAYGGRPTTEALDLVVESRRKRELLSNAVDVAEAQVAAAKEAEQRAEAQTKLAKERSAKLSAALDAAGRDARKKKSRQKNLWAKSGSGRSPSE